MLGGRAYRHSVLRLKIQRRTCFIFFISSLFKRIIIFSSYCFKHQHNFYFNDIFSSHRQFNSIDREKERDWKKNKLRRILMSSGDHLKGNDIRFALWWDKYRMHEPSTLVLTNRDYPNKSREFPNFEIENSLFRLLSEGMSCPKCMHCIYLSICNAFSMLSRLKFVQIRFKSNSSRFGHTTFCRIRFDLLSTCSS